MKFLLLLGLMFPGISLGANCSPGVLICQQSDNLEIESGGTLNVDGTFVLGGTTISATGTELNTKEISIVVDAEGTNTGRAVAPSGGTISTFTCSLNEDPLESFSAKLTINGVDVTGGTWTAGNGSASYAEFTVSPSGANTVTVADHVSVVVTDAASTAGSVFLGCHIPVSL